MTCPKASKKCGGTVDRLAPLVFLIYVASRTHRLFLIHWGRPAALEEFLLPPPHGVDWRFDEATSSSTSNSVLATTLEALVETTESNHMNVRCRYQAPDHGAGFYDAHRATGEPSMAEITRLVWDMFFTPTPPVAQRIQQFMSQEYLVPGQYLATHIRALYAVKDQDPYVVKYWTQNAINCTTHLAETSERLSTIFVASDATFAAKVAQRHGTEFGWKVVHHIPDAGQEPLHLDKAVNWQDRSPSDYYDAFVDLYLLGSAKCVAYGMGGYGKFASWLTGNPSCALQHHNATAINYCTIMQFPVDVKQSFNFPEFPLQREVVDESDTKLAQATAFATKSSPVFPDTAISPPLENLWESSTVLPQWMKDYFVWHRQQRQLINREHWRNFRFLVAECTEQATKCGGTSDRLRPLPYLIRVAAETDRILFIYWVKPYPLENFLLPPVGGMDWRIPDWLAQLLRHHAVTSAQNLPAVASRRDVLVQARIQAHDHGSHYYDNSTAVLDGDAPFAFRRHYHDCWYVLFTPVPAIANLVENELRVSGLMPGHFGVAHVRALYGVETVGRDPNQIAQWTRNAVDCLTQIRPAGKSVSYFVASDSADARRVAVSYGVEKHVSSQQH